MAKKRTAGATPAPTAAFTASDSELLRRAMAAWFRSGGTDQPSNDSHVEVLNGLRYVVLVNTNGVLAVYRVKNDGLLRVLTRWPAALGTY